MRMQKRKLKIGELAKLLNVKHFVIRFWEKEFDLAARRTDGNQRLYEEKDLKKFSLIKELLYDKKFTIAGAKEYLNTHPVSEPISITPAKVIQESSIKTMQPAIAVTDQTLQQLAVLYKQLIRLNELL